MDDKKNGLKLVDSCTDCTDCTCEEGATPSVEPAVEKSDVKHDVEANDSDAEPSGNSPVSDQPVIKLPPNEKPVTAFAIVVLESGAVAVMTDINLGTTVRKPTMYDIRHACSDLLLDLESAHLSQVVTHELGRLLPNILEAAEANKLRNKLMAGGIPKVDPRGFRR